MTLNGGYTKRQTYTIQRLPSLNPFSPLSLIPVESFGLALGKFHKETWKSDRAPSTDAFDLALIAIAFEMERSLNPQCNLYYNALQARCEVSSNQSFLLLQANISMFQPEK